MNPGPARGPRSVAMLVHAYYEEDARVRRQAEAIVASGRPVDVYALRRPGQEPTAAINGVHVERLPVRRHQGAGIPRYLGEYLSFAVRAGWRVSRAHHRRRYALLEVHTLPDFLVLAGLGLRLAGVPILLDLHEAMPEFFAVRFPAAASPAANRLLRLQERLAIGAANRVLTVNDALRDRLVGLGVSPDRVTVILNTPALRHFDSARQPSRGFMADGTLRLVYAGALTPVYELDVALAAIVRLRESRPDLPVSLDVYGRGDAEPALRAQAIDAGIAGQVAFHGRIPLEEVPAAIAAADIGLAPTRHDRFTEMSLSTKLFEYAAMCKPVVASRLPMVERYFGQGTVRTYEGGSPASLADAILAIVDDAAARERAVVATAERIEPFRWEREAVRYLDIIESMALDGLSSSPATIQSAEEA